MYNSLCTFAQISCCWLVFKLFKSSFWFLFRHKKWSIRIFGCLAVVVACECLNSRKDIQWRRLINICLWIEIFLFWVSVPRHFCFTRILLFFSETFGEQRLQNCLPQRRSSFTQSNHREPSRQVRLIRVSLFLLKKKEDLITRKIRYGYPSSSSRHLN